MKNFIKNAMNSKAKSPMRGAPGAKAGKPAAAAKGLGKKASFAQAMKNFKKG
jgi:hypothetical protein